MTAPLSATEYSSSNGTTLAPQIMPDVASHIKPTVGGTLDRVGMKKVELPIQVESGKQIHTVPGLLTLFVNLVAPEEKGIHMSRLYKTANDLLPSRPLDLPLVEEILKTNLQSHSDISDTSAMDIQFELMTQRPSLLSGLEGWRSYPIGLSSVMTKEGVRHTLEITISYSSTCPCSAALARQLIQRRFEESFESQPVLDRETVFEWLGKEDSICATPHSQRSTAHIKVELGPESRFNPLALIDAAEKAIATPVQSMVKREDEQEFALLNGRNLMFCEDAGRRLKSLLTKEAYPDFRCEIKHMESLHPHDAVAIVTKGVPGGFSA